MKKKSKADSLADSLWEQVKYSEPRFLIRGRYCVGLVRANEVVDWSLVEQMEWGNSYQGFYRQKVKFGEGISNEKEK